MHSDLDPCPHSGASNPEAGLDFSIADLLCEVTGSEDRLIASHQWVEEIIQALHQDDLGSRRAAV